MGSVESLQAECRKYRPARRRVSVEDFLKEFLFSDDASKNFREFLEVWVEEFQWVSKVFLDADGFPDVFFARPVELASESGGPKWFGRFLWITMNYFELPAITLNYCELLWLTSDYYEIPAIAMNYYY